MSSKTEIIAIFGIGRAGMIHFLNLVGNRRAIVKYIVDLDIQRANQLIKDYRLDSTTTALKPNQASTVYQDKSVTGVVVSSPTFAHEGTVKEALKNGKGVFCEKPIADSIEAVSACYDEAKKSGKTLLCSFNRRFDPAISSLRNRVLAGEIGDVHVAKTCSRDHPFPPLNYMKISGGMFHDCAVHDIDFLCWTIGEYPSSVYAIASCFNKDIIKMNDVDTVVISLRFPSGALGCIDLSRNANFGYDQRLEVFGTKGMLQSENVRPTGVVLSNDNGTKGDMYEWSFPERYKESYAKGLEHFIDVLQGVCEPMIGAKETLIATKLIEACEESYKTGKPVDTSKIAVFENNA